MLTYLIYSRKVGQGTVDVQLLVQSDTSSSGSIVFSDSSSHNRTITRVQNGGTGISHDTAHAKFGLSSIRKEGQANALQATMDSLTTEPFTMESWVRFNGTDIDKYHGLLDLRGVTNYVKIFKRRSGHLTNPNMVMRVNGADTDIGMPPLGSWFHLAVVRQGTSITCYVDGVSVGTYSSFPSDFNESAAIFSIGQTDQNNDVWQELNWMDEVRFSYTPVYTSNFTPPTEAF